MPFVISSSCYRSSVAQDIKATDLVKIAVLGSGAFGQVMLVKHESAYMALKSLSKQQILEMGLHVSMLLSIPIDLFQMLAILVCMNTSAVLHASLHFCGD